MFDAHADLPLFSPEPAAVERKSRAQIKAAGGGAYANLLAKERAARKLFRQRHPEYWRDNRQRRGFPFKTELCARARLRGRKKGIEATITAADLEWPTHCPVLGIELDYPERSGQRGTGIAQANWPSLDRLDPTKGYVPGNVFVISFRANMLKSAASYEELLLVAKYIARRRRRP